MNGVLTRVTADPSLATVFRTYQCGLCHTLEAEYGFRYRLFATADAVFLNVFLDARAGAPAGIVRRACPLAPVVSRNLPVRASTEHTRLAAAWTVYLGVAKLEDDVKDEGGFHRRVAAWLFRPGARRAEAFLRSAGVPVAELRAAMARQAQVEQDRGPLPLDVAAAPTRQIAAHVFGAEVGPPLGAFLFHLDNLLDFGADRAARRYNALDPLIPAGTREVPAAVRASGIDAARDAVRGLSRAVRALPASDLRAFIEDVLVRGFLDKLTRLEALPGSRLAAATLRDVQPPRPTLGGLLRRGLALARSALARATSRWRLAAALATLWVFPRWSRAQEAAGEAVDTGILPGTLPLADTGTATAGLDTAWDGFLDSCFCPRCVIVACENACTDVDCCSST